MGVLKQNLPSHGFPPHFLRIERWRVYSSDLPGKRKLAHVDGLNVCLRSKTPAVNFPMSQKRSSTVTVGKWYCPFPFIRVYVPVRTSFRKEEALLAQGKFKVNESNVADGMLVLRGGNEFGTLVGVGLSQKIVEKMRIEQGGGRQEGDPVSVKSVFECKDNAWTKFGCYHQEGRHVLRRMDETVMITYIFRDPHQIKPKWE